MFILSKRIKIHPAVLAIFFTVLLIIVSIAFGYLVQNLKLFAWFDDSVYSFFQFNWHPAWLTLIIVPFNFNFIPLGNQQFLSFLLVIIILTYLYIFIWRRRDRLWALWALLIAGIFDLLLAWLIPLIIFRPRPFLILPNNVSQTAMAIWQTFPSYPSGHTRDTALFLTVLAAFLPKFMRWPFTVFVLFIGFSRVFLGAHYPTDVIATIFIGYLMAKIVLSIVEEIRKVREVHLHPPS